MGELKNWRSFYFSANLFWYDTNPNQSPRDTVRNRSSIDLAAYTYNCSEVPVALDTLTATTPEDA
jgi:hypothetical protein